MDLGLKGKVAVVTGSSRGIGAEIALSFAREGANIAVHYIASKEGAEKTVRLAKEMGVDVAVFQADVSKSEDVARFFREVNDTFGTIDILVNNAATVAGGPTVSVSDENYRTVMGSALDGTFFCTREALKTMIGKRSGKIINISSIAGIGYIPEASIYATAKAGVIGLTRAVAYEVASMGIQVNAVAPGNIDTPLVAKLGQSEWGKKVYGLQHIPMGRLGKMSEIAGTVLFLASQAADYIVGEVIVVGGGLMNVLIE